MGVVVSLSVVISFKLEKFADAKAVVLLALSLAFLF